MVEKLITLDVLLWAGMVIGISFLESWVKFRAPTLIKAIGLDVGRTVFRFFHKAQCGLWLILLVLSVNAKLEMIQWIAVTILTLILLLQLVWLFPKLNQRVEIIQAGNPLPASNVHTLYGILEILKLLILMVLAWNVMP